MLKQIKKEQVPKEVWDTIADKNAPFIEFYQIDGMFGILPDYLLILEKHDTTSYFGYVYNGNAPECSEFGSFGLTKTERIW